MYTALRATTQTLAAFARGRLRADPILGALFDPGAGGTMDVTLSSPQEMNELNAEGLSVWLYRVARDDERLNAPPTRVSPTLVRRPPLPLRLHYLVTPVTAANLAGGGAAEQVILGRVLQIFHDSPVLRGLALQDDFSGTEIELHVRLESLGLDEMSRVWEALEATYQLCVSYEVSLVEIDSATEPESTSPVTVVESEFALVVGAESP